MTVVARCVLTLRTAPELRVPRPTQPRSSLARSRDGDDMNVVRGVVNW